VLDDSSMPHPVRGLEHPGAAPIKGLAAAELRTTGAFRWLSRSRHLSAGCSNGHVGFEIRTVGANLDAARYAGMHVGAPFVP